MKFAATVLALWFVPFAVVVFALRDRGGDVAVFFATAGGALALWGLDVAVGWWRRRGAGGWI